MNKIPFNLRIDEDLNEKLILVAHKESRSKNAQIEYILRKYVSDYENLHNDINISAHEVSNQDFKVKRKK